VLWNCHYFLRFRFRFRLLKIMVPVPVSAPYLDPQKKIKIKKIGKNLAFLRSKLFLQGKNFKM
jgi:hypothetical protein